ncbi:hypothetical protein AVEN_234532-1 [Araneus ventricosus]|uniref:Uncharacterized protein n=1 Tax=Araneus ventricosus TaxID=182803 RepID=A0A4Y2AAB1_ARAVE|nr:hypothetical protein AVEN_234532-1 [Araneus ventricosus]
MHHEKFTNIKETVLRWFISARAKTILVIGLMLQRKEKKIEDALFFRYPKNALDIEKFSASNSCLDMFRFQNNVKLKSQCGEVAEVCGLLRTDLIDHSQQLPTN